MNHELPASTEYQYELTILFSETGSNSFESMHSPSVAIQTVPDFASGLLVDWYWGSDLCSRPGADAGCGHQREPDLHCIWWQFNADVEHG